MQLNPLTPEESRIIQQKGTEAPHSGEYNNFKESGVFLCRQCNTALFLSNSKFDSGCGWPSFDDAIPGRIHWLADADGRRTEIECMNCHGHLGHVFVGEKITQKNTRHCVNSLSLKFSKEIPSDIPQFHKAYFGGGCFWCTEAVFSRLRGVLEVHSGYMGGHLPFPTYERICSGVSGYIEIVEVIYDRTVISYETLLQVFFSSHDPTSLDKQGNDAGTQYKSIVFGNEEDLKIAENSIKELQNEGIFSSPIITELRPLEVFYIAEDYHQNYYSNNPKQSYCQYVINPKIQKLKDSFAPFLK